MKMKKQTKKQALANSWLEPHITTPQNLNDYNVKGGNAAPAGNRPTHRVWWDNLSDSSKAFLCREHYCHEQHETLKESEIDNIFRKEHNRPAAPPPAGNDPELKTFIIGYSNDENVTEGLMQFKDKADADFRSEEWCEVNARTLQEAFDKYEEAFLKWKGEQSKIHPGTTAGNDLPQQLELPETIKEEWLGVMSSHITAEIARRYNDFPALQEQNKELIEALRGMLTCYRELVHNMGSYQTAWCTKYTTPARNILSKYSK